jgi:molecular chaperone DnaJ
VAGSGAQSGGKATHTMPNYYQWLGCDAFAEADAVKSAYRQLARKHHPDLNPTDPKAEERFKQINEAYATLSDTAKRANYDRALRIKLGIKQGDVKPQAKSSAPNHVKAKPKPQPSSSKAPFQGWVDGFFKAGSPPNVKPAPAPPKADPPKPPPHNTPPDPPAATKPAPSVASPTPPPAASAHNSQSFKEASTKAPTGAIAGEDVTVETHITSTESLQGTIKLVNVQHNDLCRRCSGTGKVMGTPCSQCHGDKTVQRLRKLEVRIPAGVKTGSRVRVAGEGGKGMNGADDGDLFLQVVVDGVDPKRLKVDGINVYSDLTLELPASHFRPPGHGRNLTRPH